jgi:hypothetical protein
MTIPAERTRAILQTRKFLEELQRMPRQFKAVRAEARRLLRHYPEASDIDQSRAGFFEVFGPANEHKE